LACGRSLRDRLDLTASRRCGFRPQGVWLGLRGARAHPGCFPPRILLNPRHANAVRGPEPDPAT
jgi:hypothetical protein